MKSVILNVRISQDLKDKLANLSNEKNVSISNIIRKALNDCFCSSEEVSNDVFEQDNLYHSNEFIFLVTWIFEKVNRNEDTYSKIQLLILKNTVIKVIHEESFPYALRQEFEKVLADLVQYINDFESEHKRLNFCVSNHSLYFDYDILIKHILSRAFEKTD